MKKYIYIISLILIVLATLFALLIIKNKDNNQFNAQLSNGSSEEYNPVNDYYNYRISISNHLKKDATSEEQEIIYNYAHYPRKAITEMCKKNGNWELIPIDDAMYQKYDEKNGILKGIDFDKIEAVDEEQVGMAVVIVTKGRKKTRYTIDYSVGDLITDIEIFEETLLIDDNGIEQDIRYKFIGDRIKINFNVLCDDGVIWDNGEIVGSDIALTSKFRKKYPLFLDLFIHYSPLDYNSISFILDKSDFSKNMAYFTVNSVLECKKREYEVYYTLDKDKYLDDASVRLVKEVDTEPNHSNSGIKSFYLNSNLDNTNLSDDFKLKIKKYGSYNSDINNMDINIEPDSERIEKGKYIRCYRMKDGTINSYLVEYNGTETEVIYDIISTKLPYTNMSAKEVKDLYLKEHNQ